MADPEERLALVPAAVDALGGPLDILINNAAAGIYKPNLGYTLKHRRLMMDVNFDAPVDLTQQVVPGMIERGEGWIVNVSSGVARYHYGPPDLTAPRAPGRAGRSARTRVCTARAKRRSTASRSRSPPSSRAPVCGSTPSSRRAAVMSDGAVARGMDGIPESAVQSMEAMVESIVYLCACPEERTGGVHTSLDLLDEVGLTVMTLDGSAPFPGGYRRVLDG